MAKRTILGVLTGKLGNMVGQSNSLVTGTDKQVWRIYNGSVKNPKSVKQAEQRALFVSVKNFAQALSRILDHSWQGVDYGTKSLNHFRKLVLANGGVNYPGFIIQEKGSQDAIPQPYPIAAGSIPFNDSISFADADMIFINGFQYVNITATTEGDYWTKFLADNPALKDGDMITVVAFVGSGGTPDVYSEMYPVYDRFIIDTKSTTAITANHPKSQTGIYILTSDEIEGVDKICAEVVGISDATVIAAGVIISRQIGNKAKWQRSNSRMYVTQEYRNWVMTQDYINSVLESYMNSAANAESDWYLNETGVNTAEGGQTGAEFVSVRNMPLSNGSTRTLAYYSKGNRNGYLYHGSGTNRNYYTLDGMEINAVKLADGVTANTTDLINMDTVQEQLERASYWVRNLGDQTSDQQPD